MFRTSETHESLLHLFLQHRIVPVRTALLTVLQGCVEVCGAILLRDYNAWARENKHRMMDRGAFAQCMEKLFPDKSRWGFQGYYYIGLVYYPSGYTDAGLARFLCRIMDTNLISFD